jgi:hypothetical protein
MLVRNECFYFLGGGMETAETAIILITGRKVAAGVGLSVLVSIGVILL